ncbi:MAG: hypothetical protein QNL88_05415 [Acidobacteriota bacterium]|nr:hypothetical protein [Acidobacteriota bacterium]
MRLSVTIGLFLVFCSPLNLPAQVLVDDTFDENVDSWPAGWENTIVWDPLDEQGSSSSGSALVTNISTTAGDATGSQLCVEGIEAGELYRVGADVLVPEGQTETGVARLLLRWYGDGCAGSQTGSWVITNEIDSSDSETWLPVSAAGVAPEETRSARIRLGIRKSEADGSLAAHFDNVVFERLDLSLTFVPAAGYAEGNQGSFWVTDLEVNNPWEESMVYELWWLPRNTDNSNPTVSDLFSLAPGESRRHANVLCEVFGLDPAAAPFGAVAVAAEGKGAMVMARVFNLGDGTYGQSIPGVSPPEMTGPNQRRRILFMSENEAFRANLGCQNGGSGLIGVQFERFDNSGASLGTGFMNLPPLANNQVNRVFADWAPAEGYVEVWSVNSGARFFCYASVIDNTSNDPTTVLPQ